MSAVTHARVVEQLTRLRLRYVAERIDALLGDAARTEPTYLDFLDSVLRQEVDAKQRTRVTMGLKIAHFPAVKTLDDFDFKFQPSVDQRLVRELATARFLTQAENVLVFGAPGVGKTHLAIALGRAIVEAGHTVLFTSATALLAALAKAETDGQLADRLLFYSKPKLLIIDELGYLPFERRSAPSLPSARRPSVRARQLAHHHESVRDAVGYRLRRRGPRRGDPRPSPASQPHTDDPR
jgi:DNA replication protein DnaC